MFSLGNQLARTCGGVDRRNFLRVGGLATFGLSLPQLLQAEATQSGSTRKDVNCILFWMGGGPSNIDTFDMKPDAPAEYRGEFRPIDSALPGLPVCEHLPLMAKQMDKVCLLRSVTHTESGDHTAANHYMLTGYPQRPDPSGQPANSLIYPAYGSVVSREKGWQNSMPPYVVLTGKPAGYMGSGYLGSAYSPLSIKADPNELKFAVQDVSIPDVVGTDRTSRRRTMLAELDQWQRLTDRKLEPLVDRDRFYQQAYDLSLRRLRSEHFSSMKNQQQFVIVTGGIGLVSLHY